MRDTLPAAIIPQWEAFGRAVGELVRANADGTLEDLERALLATLRAHAPQLLAAVVAGTQSSLQPAARGHGWPCPGCGARVRVQSWRPRTVTTVCGAMTFERPWHACRGCRRGFSPTDRTLGLAPRARLSAGCREWVVTEGADGPFAAAAARLDRLAGVRVSAETARRQTERCGLAWEAADAAAAATVERTREAAEPVDAAPGQLVVEADGVMVLYRETGYHEVKVGLVGGAVEGRLVAQSYVAAREDAAAFGVRWLTEAARRGALAIVGWDGSPLRRQRALLREVAVLGDGAKWIWALAAEHFDRRVEILDNFHANEHLWTLAHALFGDGTAAAAEWATGTIGDLLLHGSAGLLPALRTLRADTPADQDVLRREREYFRRNAERIEYPDFRTRGLPVASGGVEGAAGYLVGLRLKRPGARWSTDGAHGVLTMRCRLLSHRPLLPLQQAA
jgi:hypothetical protein